MKRRYSLIPIVALGLTLACATQAEPTALDLVKKGNDYVGIQSKDKIVEIRSDKSIGSLTPNIWYVVFYDPDTPPFKCVEIKFGGGQEMEVSHPFRPFQLPGEDPQIFDKATLKVDSDRALNLATAQPVLKPLTLKAAKLTLTHGDLGPVWKVQLWAAKLSDPSREADVGTVTLSATDGTVERADLHPNKAE